MLDERASRENIARQLAEVTSQFRLVVVHGGGKQMTRYLAERGLTSRFVNGLRVSDETVIDAASKVIAGSVNKQFVAALTAAGQLAVGLCGVDGRITTATRMKGDLGFVGVPLHSNGAFLDLLSGAGYLPVVGCLAADEQGTIYNVNADQMAVSCALGFRAEKLVFLTDVPGVKNTEGRVVMSLAPERARALIHTGAAHGGMQAKLEAACQALESGVEEVVIAPGQEPRVCARLLAGEPLGTSLRLSPASQAVTL